MIWYRFRNKSVLSNFGMILVVSFLVLYLTAFWIMGIVGRQLTEERYDALNNGLDRCIDNFGALYETAYSISAEISMDSVFRKSEATSSVQSELACIKALKAYSASAVPFYIYYDTGYIYSSIGKNNWKNYQKYTLEAQKEQERISGDDFLFWINDINMTNGSLFLAFPIDRYSVENLAEGISLFRISLDKIGECCSLVLDRESVCISIELPNGQLILLEGGNYKIRRLIPQTDSLEKVLEERLGKKYVSIEREESKTGLCLTVYYKTDEVYGDISRSILKNILRLSLLIIGLFLGTFLSFRRILLPLKKIKESASIAQQADFDACKNELEYFGKILEMAALEKEQYSNKIEDSMEMLKEQSARMLFYGQLKPEMLGNVKELCGVEVPCGYFAAVVLRVWGGYACVDDWIREYCRDQLMFKEQSGGVSYWCFLEELEGEDQEGKFRTEKGKNFLKLLNRETDENGVIVYGTVVTKPNQVIASFFEAQWEMQKRDQHTGHKNEVIVANRGLFAFTGEWKLSKNAKKYLSELNDAEARGNFLKKLCTLLELSSVNYEEKRKGMYSVLDEFSKIEGGNFFGERTEEGVDEQASLADSFEEVLEYIRKNVTDYNLSLESVAEYCNVTKSYLSRYFKIRTGKKYIDYVSELRMEKACALLKENTYSTVELAGLVGYTDVGYFRKKFQNTYGVTVSEYRNTQVTARGKM